MTAETQGAVRVRIAPSPTGLLHIGTARTALFNFLFAKKHGGAFIVRIEDTDQERSSRDHERSIIEGLKWLGLEWDEGPEMNTDSKGKYGPYRQSERSAIYKKYLQKLLKEEKAYVCYCTKEDLEAQKQFLVSQGLPPKYTGHCRSVKGAPQGMKPQVIRFKMPEGKVSFHDLIRGNVSFDASLIGDLAIAKTTDSVLFDFANVVDDYEMRITHVIRGEDHISNTPKHILLAYALGFPQPQFAHLPLILNSDRSKLSKRKNETSLLAYREKGYLPEATINFLAMLGWHPKGDKEIFSLPELIHEFDLKRVQKSGAIFNQEKLDWLNSQHIKALPIHELVSRLQPFIGLQGGLVSQVLFERVASTVQPRLHTLADFLNEAGFYFQLPAYEPALLIWKQDTAGKTLDIFQQLIPLLDGIDNAAFNRDHVGGAIAALSENIGRGSVYWPFRVALSGKSVSPDPLEISDVLGKETTLTRLRNALEKLRIYDNANQK